MQKVAGAARIALRPLGVLGIGPLARAVSTVLTTLLAGETGLYPWRWSSRDFFSGRRLEKPNQELLIAVAPPGAESSEVIRLVRFLRTDLLWEGSILVLIDGGRALQAIETASLIGATEPATPYSEVGGHAALATLFRLPDLFDVLGDLRPMFQERWHAILDLQPLGELAERLERLVSSDRDLDESEVEEVLAIIRQLDWTSLLLDHDSEARVQALLGTELSATQARDLQALVHQAAEIVALALRRGVR